MNENKNKYLRQYEPKSDLISF